MINSEKDEEKNEHEIPTGIEDQWEITVVLTVNAKSAEDATKLVEAVLEEDDRIYSYEYPEEE